jgi:hypothetical protein
MRIEVSKLGKEAAALASFLEPRLAGKLSRGDSGLELDTDSEGAAPNTQRVKTYIKRFLHNTGLRGRFRVIADQEGLRIVQVGKAAAEEAS